MLRTDAALKKNFIKPIQNTPLFSRSTIFAEIISDECGKMLKVKNATRWNSEYDAYQRLSELLNNSRDNLAGHFRKLNLTPLSALKLLLSMSL